VRAEQPTRIRQAYLSIEPTEVRVRSSDDREHELTIKSIGGLERTEVTLPLTPAQFEELWTLASASIEKDRFRHGSAEVDVYSGKLAGLVVVEVEFSTDAEAAGFAPPSWFGAEVTEDRRYRNSALACTEAPPA
jgi:CYTH domain-containing protein